MAAFEIQWHDFGRSPKSPPNPAYPDGMDVDVSMGAKKTCTAQLAHPTARCGMYTVACKSCGFTVSVTTAGRPDDPRSVKIACRL